MKKAIYLFISAVFFNVNTSFSKEYKFDTRFISEGTFDTLNNNLLLSGNYIVHTYVNDVFLGEQEIYLKESNGHITPCIIRDDLFLWGFIKDKINNMPFDKEQCIIFGKDISFNYDISTQILKISANDSLIQHKNSDIEESSLWDNGITAFLLNYRANYLKSSTQVNNEYIQGQFEPGFNFGPWRFRNMSLWRKTADQNSFESSYSYLERALPSIKSTFSIGDGYTKSDSFDTIPFRGVSLASDENMIPYTMRAYSPVITGIAKTNAQVEVSHNGYTLYTVTVAPGPFEIKDASLFNINSGPLDVKIIESNGEIQQFTVPFSKPVFSLAEGYFRYNINSGMYRNYYSTLEKQFFFEGGASYGFPLGISSFGGVQIAKKYNSLAIGVSKDFGKFGALSTDWKISKSKAKNDKEFLYGNALGFKYNKSINKTSTNIDIASYHFYSPGYRTISEVFDTFSDNGTFNINSRKNNLSLGINQSMDKYGYLYLGYYNDKYWKGRERNSFTAKYNKHFGNTLYSLSFTKSRVKNKKNEENDENIFSFWLSVPFGDVRNNPVYARYQLTSSTGQSILHEAGFSGSGFDQRLNWDIREQTDTRSHQNLGSYLSGSWRGTYGQVGFNYSHNERYHDFGGNISGGIVVHDQGITFGQRLANTTALIEAKDISGAKVLTTPGTYTDFRGYTVTGILSPYKKNTLSISPEAIPDNSDIRQTDVTVIPSEGAIVRAKFTTVMGANALMTILTRDGKLLPLGTIISMKDDKNTAQSTFIVGDNGQVYISGLNPTGRLHAVWGRKTNERCDILYDMKHSDQKQNIFFLTGQCK